MADENDVPGYSRAKFPHWITQYGTCDTREVTLQRDGQGVVQDDQCRAISGTWYSEYDGKTVESASGIDIDHIVPLKEAWRSGAARICTRHTRSGAEGPSSMMAGPSCWPPFQALSAVGAMIPEVGRSTPKS
ncbi:hypothetical protein [Streptomyces sp. NPDC102437]|uniref:hypothetical protein n=1 Tax=Streptomyces sp. NPDC102437 TaxID=3366175 RepID=UPI0038078745